MGTLVRKAGYQRICDCVDDLADACQQSHDGDKSKQFVLRQKVRQAAGCCRLEKIDQIVSYHAVKQPLGNIRKAVTTHFSFG